MAPRLLRALFAFALILSMTACASDDSATEGGADGEGDTARADVPQVVVEAGDFSFSVPEGITAGLTEVVLRNNGAEPHHAQLARLNDGVTLEQFQAALQEGPGAALGMVAMVGGAMTAPPGGETSATIALAEGPHVALCFIEGTDHVPHLAKGMVQPFTVGPAAEGEVQSPEADATITMVDFGFDAGEVVAGEQTIEFVNTGEQPHETAIVTIPAAQSDAVDAWLKQPTEQPPLPPMTVGGIQALAPDLSGFSTVEFEAGASYLLLCFVPDSGSGKPHFQLGMAKRLDVP